MLAGRRFKLREPVVATTVGNSGERVAVIVPTSSVVEIISGAASGLRSPITNLEPYSGVLVWQDRRNSVDILDPTTGNVIACYVHCGTNTQTSAQYKTNNVTADSPGLSMSDGTGTMVLKGAIYQPRGAWYQLYPGGTGVGNSPLQILTGMLNCGSGTGGSGCGNTAVTLLGPSNPIITYLPVLIQ